MAPPNTFDKEMRALESEIKRLESEYHMFFSGRLARLPWDRRAQVEALVKAWDRKETRNTADLFRFQSLQARFVKFIELWERQLREREEGGRSREKTRSRHAPPPAKGPDAIVFKRADAETDRVKELYERVSEARRSVGEEPLPFERLAALVTAQLKKHGGKADVAFQIAVKGGKVSLTVRTDKG